MFFLNFNIANSVIPYKNFYSHYIIKPAFRKNKCYIFSEYSIRYIFDLDKYPNIKQLLHFGDLFCNTQIFKMHTQNPTQHFNVYCCYYFKEMKLHHCQ